MSKTKKERPAHPGRSKKGVIITVIMIIATLAAAVWTLIWSYNNVKGDNSSIFFLTWGLSLTLLICSIISYSVLQEMDKKGDYYKEGDKPEEHPLMAYWTSTIYLGAVSFIAFSATSIGGLASLIPS